MRFSTSLAAVAFLGVGNLLPSTIGAPTDLSECTFSSVSFQNSILRSPFWGIQLIQNLQAVAKNLDRRVEIVPPHLKPPPAPKPAPHPAPPLPPPRTGGGLRLPDAGTAPKEVSAEVNTYLNSFQESSY